MLTAEGGREQQEEAGQASGPGWEDLPRDRVPLWTIVGASNAEPMGLWAQSVPCPCVACYLRRV